MSDEDQQQQKPKVYDTKVVHVNPESFADEEIAEAARLLRDGELVGMPTETVYGLAANAFDATAVANIFKAKGRPQDNPLIVHVSDMAMLEKVVDHIPERARLLAEHFWPGPLTMIFRKRVEGGVPSCVTAGLATVAVRFPVHPVAKRLIALSGVPIAAPSANVSGKPSPTTAAHVLHDMAGRIPMIVDGGICDFGVESTVVDVECAAAGGLPIILRPGGLTLEKIRQVLPETDVYSAAKFGGEMAKKPPTPGLKYRHYAPKAPVYLYDPKMPPQSFVFTEKMGRAVAARMDEFEGKRIGVIKAHEAGDAWEYEKFMTKAKVEVTRVIGDERTRIDDVERGLFDALRFMDEQDVDVIFAEGVSDLGPGLAIMNRFKKAAFETIDLSLYK